MFLYLYINSQDGIWGRPTSPPPLAPFLSPLRSWDPVRHCSSPRALRRRPHRAARPPASRKKSPTKVGGLGVFNGKSIRFNYKILNRKAIYNQSIIRMLIKLWYSDPGNARASAFDDLVSAGELYSMVLTW